MRYLPFEETRFLGDLLNKLPYVVVAKDKTYLDIYFSGDHRIDRRGSDDQAFGANKIFSTDQGEWVISFDTTALSMSEMEHIYTADADWLSTSLNWEG